MVIPWHCDVFIKEWRNTITNSGLWWAVWHYYYSLFIWESHTYSLYKCFRLCIDYYYLLFFIYRAVQRLDLMKSKASVLSSVGYLCLCFVPFFFTQLKGLCFCVYSPAWYRVLQLLEVRSSFLAVVWQIAFLCNFPVACQHQLCLI